MPDRKDRKPIPPKLAAQLLYESASACCVCGEPKHVTIHHIDEDPSNNDPDNLAVLCLEHHNNAHVTGGFARRLSADAIRKYRDEWLVRVKRRRDAADERVIALASADFRIDRDGKAGMEPAALRAYINHLPGALSELYAAEQPNFDSGITSEMVQGTVRIADALEKMWLLLVEDYPTDRFGKDPHQYVSAYRAERGEFHWSLAHPTDEHAGTMVRPMIGFSVVADLERMVEQTVIARMRFEDFDLAHWLERWRKVSLVYDDKAEGWLSSLFQRLRRQIRYVSPGKAGGFSS